MIKNNKNLKNDPKDQKINKGNTSQKVSGSDPFRYFKDLHLEVRDDISTQPFQHVPFKQVDSIGKHQHFTTAAIRAFLQADNIRRVVDFNNPRVKFVELFGSKRLIRTQFFNNGDVFVHRPVIAKSDVYRTQLIDRMISNSKFPHNICHCDIKEKICSHIINFKPDYFISTHDIYYLTEELIDKLLNIAPILIVQHVFDPKTDIGEYKEGERLVHRWTRIEGKIVMQVLDDKTYKHPEVFKELFYNNECSSKCCYYQVFQRFVLHNDHLISGMLTKFDKKGKFKFNEMTALKTSDSLGLISENVVLMTEDGVLSKIIPIMREGQEMLIPVRDLNNKQDSDKFYRVKKLTETFEFSLYGRKGFLRQEGAVFEDLSFYQNFKNNFKKVWLDEETYKIVIDLEVVNKLQHEVLSSDLSENDLMKIYKKYLITMGKNQDNMIFFCILRECIREATAAHLRMKQLVTSSEYKNLIDAKNGKLTTGKNFFDIFFHNSDDDKPIRKKEEKWNDPKFLENANKDNEVIKKEKIKLTIPEITENSNHQKKYDFKKILEDSKRKRKTDLLKISEQDQLIIENKDIQDSFLVHQFEIKPIPVIRECKNEILIFNRELKEGLKKDDNNNNNDNFSEDSKSEINTDIPYKLKLKTINDNNEVMLHKTPKYYQMLRFNRNNRNNKVIHQEQLEYKQFKNANLKECHELRLNYYAPNVKENLIDRDVDVHKLDFEQRKSNACFSGLIDNDCKKENEMNVIDQIDFTETHQNYLVSINPSPELLECNDIKPIIDMKYKTEVKNPKKLLENKSLSKKNIKEKFKTQMVNREIEIQKELNSKMENLEISGKLVESEKKFNFKEIEEIFTGGCGLIDEFAYEYEDIFNQSFELKGGHRLQPGWNHPLAKIIINATPLIDNTEVSWLIKDEATKRNEKGEFIIFSEKFEKAINDIKKILKSNSNGKEDELKKRNISIKRPNCYYSSRYKEGKFKTRNRRITWNNLEYLSHRGMPVYFKKNVNYEQLMQKKQEKKIKEKEIEQFEKEYQEEEIEVISDKKWKELFSGNQNDENKLIVKQDDVLFEYDDENDEYEELEEIDSREDCKDDEKFNLSDFLRDQEKLKKQEENEIEVPSEPIVNYKSNILNSRHKTSNWKLLSRLPLNYGHCADVIPWGHKMKLSILDSLNEKLSYLYNDCCGYIFLSQFYLKKEDYVKLGQGKLDKKDLKEKLIQKLILQNAKFKERFEKIKLNELIKSIEARNDFGLTTYQLHCIGELLGLRIVFISKSDKSNKIKLTCLKTVFNKNESKQTIFGKMTKYHISHEFFLQKFNEENLEVDIFKINYGKEDYKCVTKEMYEKYHKQYLKNKLEGRLLDKIKHTRKSGDDDWKIKKFRFSDNFETMKQKLPCTCRHQQYITQRMKTHNKDFEENHVVYDQCPRLLAFCALRVLAQAPGQDKILLRKINDFYYKKIKPQLKTVIKNNFSVNIKGWYSRQNYDHQRKFKYFYSNRNNLEKLSKRKNLDCNVFIKQQDQEYGEKCRQIANPNSYVKYLLCPSLKRLEFCLKSIFKHKYSVGKSFKEKEQEINKLIKTYDKFITLDISGFDQSHTHEMKEPFRDMISMIMELCQDKLLKYCDPKEYFKAMCHSWTTLIYDYDELVGYKEDGTKKFKKRHLWTLKTYEKLGSGQPYTTVLNTFTICLHLQFIKETFGLDMDWIASGDDVLIFTKSKYSDSHLKKCFYSVFKTVKQMDLPMKNGLCLKYMEITKDINYVKPCSTEIFNCLHCGIKMCRPFYKIIQHMGFSIKMAQQKHGLKNGTSVKYFDDEETYLQCLYDGELIWAKNLTFLMPYLSKFDFNKKVEGVISELSRENYGNDEDAEFFYNSRNFYKMNNLGLNKNFDYAPDRESTKCEYCNTYYEAMINKLYNLTAEEFNCYCAQRELKFSDIHYHLKYREKIFENMDEEYEGEIFIIQ